MLPTSEGERWVLVNFIQLGAFALHTAFRLLVMYGVNKHTIERQPTWTVSDCTMQQLAACDQLIANSRHLGANTWLMVP